MTESYNFLLNKQINKIFQINLWIFTKILNIVLQVFTLNKNSYLDDIYVRVKINLIVFPEETPHLKIWYSFKIMNSIQYFKA